MSKKFLGLITKCKDEFFVEEFCNYYLNQGVDRIIIIDDDSIDKNIYNNLLNKKEVDVFFKKDIHLGLFFWNWCEKLKNEYEWIIYVDIDEFIVTKKNINKTIRNELQTTFKNAHCVKVPWVIMSCNSLKENPSSILQELTHRWDHNKKHPHKENKFRCRYDSIEVKSIFKPEFFKAISEHCPRKHVGPIEKIRDGIKNETIELNPFYANLREGDIKNGYLLCYHYRIISINNCIKKLKINKLYKSHTLKDLIEFDNPEVVDETLKRKSLLHKKGEI